MNMPEKSRIMRTPAMTRREIEEKLSKMGDYVKIGYLQTCLKNQIDFDTRRFVLLNLTQLYESKKMFSDAGKSMKMAAEIGATDQSKMNDLLKSVEMFIKAGNYDDAELIIKKSLGIANAKQKEEVKNSVKNFYLSQSNVYIQKDKRKQAAEVYETLLTGDLLNQNEKADIQKKLLSVYENLGRIRDYYNLKQKIGI